MKNAWPVAILRPARRCRGLAARRASRVPRATRRGPAPGSAPGHPRSGSAPRSAYTLLEVILALAILTGALAVLGELIRQGTRHAQQARDLSLAAVICEGKLGELAAGLIPAQGVRQSPVPDFPGWLFSVENDVSSGIVGGATQPNQVGLLKLRVTVEQDPDQQRRPVRLTVTQWVLDPATTGKATYVPASAYYDSTGTIVTATSTQSSGSQGTNR